MIELLKKALALLGIKAPKPGPDVKPLKVTKLYPKPRKK